MTGHAEYSLPKVEIKDYIIIIDGKSQRKNDLRTYDKIQKIPACQGNDYTTGCLLDYVYFKKHYKKIATDLSKNQALDADPKTVQKVSFIGNLDIRGKRRCFEALTRVGLPLMRNVLTPLATNVLLPLWVTVESSATDAVIQKNIYIQGMTTLLISNEEMGYVMKIVKSFRESGLLKTV